MGWYNDDHPDHEGFLVAMVPHELPRQRHGDCTLVRASDAAILRELSYPDDDHSVDAIKRVCVGCSCGWRSRELHVPYGAQAYFHPFVCGFSGHRAEVIEDRAVELWRDHLRSGLDEHALIGRPKPCP